MARGGIKVQFSTRDRIQIKAFGIHFKIFPNQYRDNVVAFGLAVAASSDDIFESLTAEQQKLAATTLRRGKDKI